VAQLAAAQRMADAVLAVWTPDAQRECAITWTNPETGLRCKGRFDSMSTTTITEIKTTRNVAADFMSRTLHSYDYHCQLAHYRMGMKALTGRDYACRIVAVEAEAPHDVAVFEIDEEALLAGEMDVSTLLRRVVECRASGVWPGRYTDPQVLTLPRWATKDDDEDLTGLGLLMPTDDDEENEEA
jgi:hypothetical protein